MESMRYWLLDGDDVAGPFEADSLKLVPGFTPESLVRPARSDGTPVSGWQRAAVVAELRLPGPFLPPSPTIRDLQVVGRLVEKADLLDAGLKHMDRELGVRDSEISDLKAALEEEERAAKELREHITELEESVREAHGLREELQRVRDEGSRQAELARDLDGKFRDLHARIGSVEALHARVRELHQELETVRASAREGGGGIDYSNPALAWNLPGGILPPPPPGWSHEKMKLPPPPPGLIPGYRDCAPPGSPVPMPVRGSTLPPPPPGMAPAAGLERALGPAAGRPEGAPPPAAEKPAPPPKPGLEPERLFKAPPKKKPKRRAWVGMLKTGLGILLSALVLGIAGYWAVQGRRKNAERTKSRPAAEPGPASEAGSSRSGRDEPEPPRRAAKTRKPRHGAVKSPPAKKRSAAKKKPVRSKKSAASKPVSGHRAPAATRAKKPAPSRKDALAFLRSYPVRPPEGMRCPRDQAALLAGSGKGWVPPGSMAEAAGCRPRLAVAEGLDIVERVRSVSRKEALELVLADIKEWGGLGKLYPMDWSAARVRAGVFRVRITERDEVTQRFVDKYEPHMRKVLEAMGRKVGFKTYEQRYEIDVKQRTVRPLNMLAWHVLDASGYGAWRSGGGKGPAGLDREGLSQASAEGMAPVYRLTPGGVPAPAPSAAP